MKLSGFMVAVVVGAALELCAAEPTRALAGGDIPKIYRMKRTKVESEALTDIGYHRKTRTLEIRFRSGEVYRYASVPPHLHQQFMGADSKGRFFLERIRGRYRFWRVLR